MRFYITSLKFYHRADDYVLIRRTREVCGDIIVFTNSWCVIWNRAQRAHVNLGVLATDLANSVTGPKLAMTPMTEMPL